MDGSDEAIAIKPLSQGVRYEGVRILEAMHEAVRYNAAVFHVIKRAMPASAKDILEFGAGDGAFIGKFHEQGFSVEGVEKDGALRTLLQSRLPIRIHEDIRLIESESRDFIYSVNVLEHIHDLDAEVAELRRVLRPQGSMFVFVPAFELLWTSLDDEVGHLRRFTRSTLTRALRTSGFEIAQMEYFDCLGFPAALGVRLLEKAGFFRYQPSSVRFYDRCIFPLSRLLDRGVRHSFGKNLVAVARKP